jgi:hypothetical protein
MVGGTNELHTNAITDFENRTGKFSRDPKGGEKSKY